MYHLFQNYDITALSFEQLFWGGHNVRIASQKLSWKYFPGAVILAGNLNVISVP